MTFKNTLTNANDMGINPYKLVTAAEVENFLIQAKSLIDTTDSDAFEKACELVYDTYMQCEGVGICTLARALADMLESGMDLDDVSWHDLCSEANAIQF